MPFQYSFAQLEKNCILIWEDIVGVSNVSLIVGGASMVPIYIYIHMCMNDISKWRYSALIVMVRDDGVIIELHNMPEKRIRNKKNTCKQFQIHKDQHL